MFVLPGVLQATLNLKYLFSKRKHCNFERNFAPLNSHTSPIFKICSILKFVDILNVECCIIVQNRFNKDSFSIFTKHFKLASATHSYNTRSMRNNLLLISSYNAARFRRKSIIHSITLIWTI